MKDMRDFIREGEAKGLCKRIKAEVDWDLELSHVAKLNEEQSGPALLFENVKGYSTPVITSVCTTTERLSLIMGQPLNSTLVDLYGAWARLGENLEKPVYVDKAAAPCKENILTGDQID
ncbi:MAG: phenylphosphate carboxylase subunit beta, partial [Desulfomonilaceae bacterium]